MKNKKGFSLVEILIVIFLLGLITTIIIINFSKTETNQKDKDWKKTVDRITSAAMVYAEANLNVKEEVFKSTGFILLSINKLIEEGLIKENELIDSRNNEQILIKDDEAYHNVKILINENYAMEYIYPAVETNYIFVEPREVNINLKNSINLINDDEIKICIKNSCTTAYNNNITISFNNQNISTPKSYKFTDTGNYTIKYQYQANIDGVIQQLVTYRLFHVYNNNCNLELNNNNATTITRNIKAQIIGDNIIKYKLEEVTNTGEIKSYEKEVDYTLSNNDGKKRIYLTCYYDNIPAETTYKDITLDTSTAECTITKSGSIANVTVTNTSVGISYKELKVSTTFNMGTSTSRKYSSNKYGFDEKNGYYTLIEPITNGRYSTLADTLINNYTCKNGKDTSCNEMYQIISKNSSNIANVYKFTSSSPYYWSRRTKNLSTKDFKTQLNTFGSDYTIDENGYFVITGEIKTDKYITINNDINNYYTCLNKTNCTTMYEINKYINGNSAKVYIYTALNTIRTTSLSLNSGTYLYTAYIRDKLDRISSCSNTLSYSPPVYPPPVNPDTPIDPTDPPGSSGGGEITTPTNPKLCIPGGIGTIIWKKNMAWC